MPYRHYGSQNFGPGIVLLSSGTLRPAEAAPFETPEDVRVWLAQRPRQDWRLTYCPRGEADPRNPAKRLPHLCWRFDTNARNQFAGKDHWLPGMGLTLEQMLKEAHRRLMFERMQTLKKMQRDLQEQYLVIKEQKRQAKRDHRAWIKAFQEQMRQKRAEETRRAMCQPTFELSTQAS